MKLEKLDNIDIQSPRSHFVNEIQNQASYICNHNDLAFNQSFMKELAQLCTDEKIDSSYYLLTDKRIQYNILIKKPSSIKTCGVVCPKFVNQYYLRHLYSSIIHNVVLSDDKKIATVVRSSTYILYYYWFFKEKTIKEISVNVCADLEAIIKLMIDRQYTTYMNKDISYFVDILSLRLRNELLLNSTNDRIGVNLRR